MRCVFAVAAGILATALLSVCVYAGSWMQDTSRPGNAGGVTNWYWLENDGSRPKACWAWIDGDGNGLAESYYFNEEGFMLAAPALPDGYTVNASGAWVKNGIIQAFPNPWVPGGKVLASDSVRSIDASSINPISTGFSGAAATHSSLSDAAAHALLMEIQAEYPEGTPWNDYELYISGNRYGYGCAAFIFMVQDRLYGAPARPSVDNTLDMSRIRVGDHLRILDNSHSVIVLEKGDGFIRVAEGDYLDTLHWGRVITEEELRRSFTYRETCY